MFPLKIYNFMTENVFSTKLIYINTNMNHICKNGKIK